MTQVCTPGSASCSNDSTARICNGDGLGYSLRGCISGQTCREGMCLSRICTPGAADCTVEGQRRVCNTDGLGYTTAACDAMRSCQSGVCRAWVCTPNQGMCLDGRTVRACSSDGLTQSDRSCGTNSSCTNGMCSGWVCVPGEGICASATERRTCNPDGLGYTNATCTTRQTCSSGACLNWVCTPNENTCSDGFTVRSCNANGLGFTTRSCATRQSCVMGTCTPWTCTPGETSCADANNVRVCNPDGLGYTTTMCQRPSNATASQCAMNACSFTCAAGYVVSGSACVGLDPPRAISPAAGAGVRRRPTFRWSLATGAAGARIQLCPDRECMTVSLTQEVIGTSYTPNSDLPTGRFFWRLFSLTNTGGVSPTASTAWPVTISDNGSGSTVSTDLNSDGLADIAIGGSGSSTTRVAFFRGLNTTAAFGVSGTSGYYFGNSLAYIGDVNGDGYQDFAIGAYANNRVYIYHGTAQGVGSTVAATLTTSTTYFGYSIVGLGDVNGDGFADIAVGTATSSTTLARVVVYYGSSTGLTANNITNLTRSDTYFGYVVAAAGDYNGDGFADLVTTGYNNSVVHLWLGGSSGISTAPTSITLPTSSCGASASGLGDFNGDGFSDFVVGCQSSSTSSNRVFVFAGRSGTPSTTPAVSLADSSTTYFGYFVRGAGDINGDGLSDLLVGDGGNGSRVRVFLSNAGSYSTTASYLVPRPTGASTTYFGRGLAGVGDVDGDGFGDVVIGDYGSSRAYIYRGQASTTTPLATTPVVLSDSSVTYFGNTIANVY